ncbi:MAG: winged helix-turn-helix transcriptional regulator [Candidatus Melainabacteria bacterium]|nr:winged helix-turn-helix transcriptional regulator [Candidatus Melainabacteria bacterium]
MFKSECISRSVRCADRSLTNAYDKALAPSGLRTTQYTMLSVLQRQSVATISELSELLELDQTTTTRNVRILEDSGLVMRVPHHDPRVKLLKLTPEGKRRRLIAFEHWQAVQNQIKSSLTDAEWEVFQKVLTKISNVSKELE